MAGEVPATASFPRCQSGAAPRAIPGYPAATPAAHNRTARIFTQMMVLGAFTTAAGIVGGLDNGLLDRFRSLPMARSAVLAGRTGADLALSVISCAAIAAADHQRHPGSPGRLRPAAPARLLGRQM